MKASVLIVDDEAGVRSALSGVLRDEGYQVEAVESGEACLERLDASRVRRRSCSTSGCPAWTASATLERLRERRSTRRSS